MAELGSIPSSKYKDATKSYRKGKVLKAEKGREMEIISKECIVLGKVTLLRGRKGPIRQIT